MEINAYGKTEGTKWLKNFVENEFQIEHIHPTNPCQDARNEFGTAIRSDITNRLGNLVLVEKSINASLGNKPFSKKRLVYSQSKLLLVHAISERPKIGTNTSIDRAVRELNPFSEWNEVSVIARQTMLGSMAREIWNVPNPEKK